MFFLSVLYDHLNVFVLHNLALSAVNATFPRYFRFSERHPISLDHLHVFMLFTNPLQQQLLLLRFCLSTLSLPLGLPLPLLARGSQRFLAVNFIKVTPEAFLVFRLFLQRQIAWIVLLQVE